MRSFCLKKYVARCLTVKEHNHDHSIHIDELADKIDRIENCMSNGSSIENILLTIGNLEKFA